MLAPMEFASEEMIPSAPTAAADAPAEAGSPRVKDSWSRGELFTGALVLVLLAFATSAQGLVALRALGSDVTYAEVVLRHAAMWTFWGLAALVLVPLWNWSSETLPTWGHWTFHVVGSIVDSLLSCVLLQRLAEDLAPAFMQEAHDAVMREMGLPPVMLPGLVVYWAICGLTSLRNARRGLASQRLEAHRVAQRNAELEASLQTARFNLLKRQVQPHFLFNALNTVACLAEEGEPARTRGVVLSLAGVLRSTLEITDADATTLGDEIHLAQQYLDVQRARFGDRFEVHWDVESPALGMELPPLLLITLMENVVEHALGRTTGSVRLEVEASARDRGMTLVVRDDGPGFPVDVLEGRASGTGLANSRARLQHLLGERQRMTLKNRPSGGATVQVEVTR